MKLKIILIVAMVSFITGCIEHQANCWVSTDSAGIVFNDVVIEMDNLLSSNSISPTRRKENCTDPACVSHYKDMGVERTQYVNDAGLNIQLLNITNENKLTLVITRFGVEEYKEADKNYIKNIVTIFENLLNRKTENTCSKYM